MSESDSFIDEVTEEVRRDKLFAVLRRYGWVGLAIVALVVGGTAWREWQKSRAETEARAFGDAVLAAMETSDPAARVAALETVAGQDADGVAGRRAVVELLAADEALRGGDRAGALARVEALAADPALPDSLRQLAQLKTVVLAGSDMDAATRDATLGELAAPGAPFRALAMEQQALALIGADKHDEALELLRQLMQEPDATAGLRRRAAQLIVVLGGDPEAA